MAVYTEIGDETLDAFIAQYDIGEALSCKGIAEGVENSNYLLHTEKGHYILTLYEKRVEKKDLPFFLGLMNHLAAGGFVSPTAIPGRDGEVLREAAGRPAAIISFLDGRSIKRIQPLHCGLLGEALAKMHVVGADFKLQRPNNLTIRDWRPLFDSCMTSSSVKPDLKLTKLISEELEYLEQNWPTGLPNGVIHADLFPDNIFFLNDQVSGVIDYYFACNDFYAYDLAICLNAWCFEADTSFNITKARKLLRSYRSVRNFSADELSALPLLCRGAALRFLLTRLYDWLNQIDGAMVKPKNPAEYVKKLRFHQTVKSAAEYGLD